MRRSRPFQLVKALRRQASGDAVAIGAVATGALARGAMAVGARRGEPGRTGDSEGD
jgi:hypothetical protein